MYVCVAVLGDARGVLARSSTVCGERNPAVGLYKRAPRRPADGRREPRCPFGDRSTVGLEHEVTAILRVRVGLVGRGG